jgi:hypothetical protein
MTTLAVTSVSSLLCQVSTCLRMSSKFRRIRSTPTEMQSISKKDFECFASTGVNTPGQCCQAGIFSEGAHHCFQSANQMLWVRSPILWGLNPDMTSFKLVVY